MRHNLNYNADRCSLLNQAVKNGLVKLNAMARNGYPYTISLKKNSLENLCTIGSWDIQSKQEWGLDWHQNEGIEIAFLSSGELFFKTDNESKNLKTDALTITQPWQKHKLGNPNLKPNKLFWIIIDLKVLKPTDDWHWPSWICIEKNDLKNLKQILTSTKKNVWNANKNIRECFSKIDIFIKNFDKNNQNNLSFLAVRINELILEILLLLKHKKITKKTNPSLYSVELFLKNLSENLPLTQHKWSVEEMSLKCGVNQTSFFNLCKKITNKTPSDFLNYLRVKNSKNMIREFPKTHITDIAMNCGFSSSQYFSTVFKRYEGTSPLDFRKTI